MRALRVDDPRGAGHGGAGRRRREVAQVYLRAHGAFVLVEKRMQRLARGALNERDESGRAQHDGHPARGEINDMLLRDEELHLASRADFGTGFHFCSILVNEPSSPTRRSGRNDGDRNGQADSL